MNPVTSLLSANDVLLNAEVADTAALFAAIGRLWEERHDIAASAVVASLSQREQLGSTGLGQGVAIPHARVDGLKKPMAAFVRPAAPIPFNAPDGKPVSFFFVLLVPTEATVKHLQVLAVIAEMFSAAPFCAQLAAAKTAAQAYQLFAAWQDNHA